MGWINPVDVGVATAEAEEPKRLPEVDGFFFLLLFMCSAVDCCGWRGHGAKAVAADDDAASRRADRRAVDFMVVVGVARKAAGPAEEGVVGAVGRAGRKMANVSDLSTKRGQNDKSSSLF